MTSKRDTTCRHLAWISRLTLARRPAISLAMARASKREQLLTGGVDHLYRHGYGGSSVQDLARATGVPKGTFHNHFASKEAFAVAALERYFAALSAIVERHLADPARPPALRIRDYFAEIAATLQSFGWMRGCLIGSFSAELADRSDLVRAALRDIYQRWTPAFVACVAAAQQAGEMRDDIAADALAEFLLDAWEGAILRMRVERSAAPLDRFQRIALDALLAPPAPPRAPTPSAAASPESSPAGDQPSV